MEACDGLLLPLAMGSLSFSFHSFALEKIDIALCIFSSFSVSLHVLGPQGLDKGSDLGVTDTQSRKMKEPEKERP